MKDNSLFYIYREEYGQNREDDLASWTKCRWDKIIIKNHRLRSPFMAILNSSFEICPSRFISNL